MTKLIKANFMRIFKNLFFKICMIFSAGLGILLDIARYIDIQNNSKYYAGLGVEYKSADGFVFSGALYLIFAVATFTAIFIGTEYSDGTIRNKLMVGLKRTEIYIANFVVCTLANIAMLMAFIAVTLGFGYFLFRATSLTAGQTAVYIASQCVTMAEFSAILVLISMLIRSKSGGAVTALIATILLFVSAISIAQRLQLPEYFNQSEAVENEETGKIEFETVTVKNPRYLMGTQRKIYEQLNNILPVNQFYQTTNHIDENLGIMAIYSAIVVILSNGIGVVIFQKKDLK